MWIPRLYSPLPLASASGWRLATVALLTISRGPKRRAPAVLSLAKPPALQDVCGQGMPMADNSLQKTARTARSGAPIKDTVGRSLDQLTK